MLYPRTILRLCFFCLAWLFGLGIHRTFPAYAADSKKILIETTTATAGLWANLRGKRGSLKFESDRLLKKSLDGTQAATCERGQGSVYFSSVPIGFLKKYNDSQKCQSLFEQTEKDPISFGPLSFLNVSELSAWFSDFSQGEGEHGEELYRRCDGACSPQYSMEIHTSSSLSATIKVVCGHARDKSKNEYQLSISRSDSCE